VQNIPVQSSVVVALWGYWEQRRRTKEHKYDRYSLEVNLLCAYIDEDHRLNPTRFESE